MGRASIIYVVSSSAWSLRVVLVCSFTPLLAMQLFSTTSLHCASPCCGIGSACHSSTTIVFARSAMGSSTVLETMPWPIVAVGTALAATTSYAIAPTWLPMLPDSARNSKSQGCFPNAPFSVLFMSMVLPWVPTMTISVDAALPTSMSLGGGPVPPPLGILLSPAGSAQGFWPRVSRIGMPCCPLTRTTPSSCALSRA